MLINSVIVIILSFKLPKRKCNFLFLPKISFLKRLRAIAHLNSTYPPSIFGASISFTSKISAQDQILYTKLALTSLVFLENLFICLLLSVGYFYQLVIVITFGLDQSDHYKRRPLYKKAGSMNALAKSH